MSTLAVSVNAMAVSGDARSSADGADETRPTSSSLPWFGEVERDTLP